MSVLNHLMEAAAVLLLLELLVVLLIFAGVGGGLVFGLRWVGGKTGGAFGKANHYLILGVRYTDQGLDYAALPAIKASGFVASAGGSLLAIKRRVQQVQGAHVGARAPATAVVGARPVPEEATPAVPIAPLT